MVGSKTKGDKLFRLRPTCITQSLADVIGPVLHILDIEERDDAAARAANEKPHTLLGKGHQRAT